MSSNHTTNYQLSQWSKSDQVLMEDFNADNAKLDAALAQKADASALAALTTLVGTPLKLAVGSYTGDGAATRVIPLPFTPKAVYLCTKSGYTYSSGSKATTYGGLAVTGHAVGNPTYPTLEIVDGGFRVSYYSTSIYTVCSNENNTVFHYIALG